MGEEGESYMGNPLQRFFKKIFTGTQKKEEKLDVLAHEEEKSVLAPVEEEASVAAQVVVEETSANIEEKQEVIQEENSLKITDYIAVEDAKIEFEAEAGLIERTLEEYIAAKVYEEKLIKELQKQGITKTSQISSGVVAFMLDYAGMTESKIKNLLKKFKGYVYFKAVEKLFTKEEWDALESTLDWHIMINVQPMYSTVKIKDVFKDVYFEPLCKLAKIKEISELGQITTSFLVSYKNYTGVGEKKYKKTLDILAQYAVKDCSFECVGIMQKEGIVDTDYEICIAPKLYEVFQNYNLAQVSMLYGEFVANGIKKLKLKNLQGKSMNEVSNRVYRPVLEETIQKLNEVVMPSVAFEAFEEAQGLEILKLRYIESCTLEETASKIGLSLEETSKLQIRTVEQLTDIMRSSKLVEILSFLNKGDDHIAFNIIEGVLGEKNGYIIDLIKHNAFHDLSYHPIFDMVFLHEVVGEEEVMEDLREVLPEVFLLNEYKEKIHEAITNIGIKKYGKDVINNLLEAMGYHASGKLYSKKEITSTYILETIFKAKVRKPLYLDEEAIENLNAEAQKMYNYALGNSLMAVEQIIKQIEDILCVGSNTYLHSSRVKCKKEVLEEINAYLTKASETACEINTNDLYDVFKGKLKGTSIKDQYGLYNIIFYYFKDQYKRDNDGGLNIILRENKKSYDDLNGLSVVAPRLQQLINKYMDQGYIKVEHFFEAMKKEDNLKAFLEANQLEPGEDIGKMLMHIDDTLLGDESFLYRKNGPYQSIEEIEAVEIV